MMLKPFLPQLQTTFLRSLSDGHRSVRLRSASALSYLIVVHNNIVHNMLYIICYTKYINMLYISFCAILTNRNREKLLPKTLEKV